MINKFCVFWAFALIIFNSSAQEEQDTTQQYIPIVEIPKYLEKTNAITNEADLLRIIPQELFDIEEYVIDQSESYDAKYSMLVENAMTYNLSKLDTEKREWESLINTLNENSKLLTTYIEKLRNKIDQVDSEMQLWLSTQEYIVEEETPVEVSDMVSEAIKKLQNSDQSLQLSQSEALKIQAKLTPLFTQANEAMRLIESNREIFLRSIWTKDEVYFWDMKSDTAKAPLFKHIRSSTSNYAKNAVEFIQTNESFNLVFLLFFIFCFGYLLMLKKNRKKIIEKYQNEEHLNLLLKYPFSTTLILTLVFTTLIFDLPESMIRAYSLLILIPVGELIYGMAEKHKWAHLSVFVTSLFLLDLHAFIQGSNAERAYTLILAILTAIGMFILLRTKGNYKLIAYKKKIFIRIAIDIFFVLSVLSIIFNVIGRYGLSEILIVGTISSFELAVIYFIGVFLTTHIISILLVASPLERSNIIKNNHGKIIARLIKILTIGAITLWVFKTLGLFKIQDYVIDSLITLFNTEIRAGNVGVSLADIFAFFFTIMLSIWISRFVRFFLEEEIYARNERESRSRGAILLIIRYSFITLGIVFAFAAAGIELDKITVLIGALGVGIGFGLQNFFNNLVSGIILAVERPMQIGDIVEVQELLGTVMDIGFRASTIRTFDGSEVVVPNGDITSSKFINWTLSDKKRRLKVDLRVSYDTDPDKVMELLHKVAESTEIILSNPPPIVRFVRYGESSLEFQLLFWISRFDNGFSSGTEVTKKVYDEITKAGIKIPYPKSDIYIHEKPKKKKS